MDVQMTVYSLYYTQPFKRLKPIYKKRNVRKKKRFYTKAALQSLKKNHVD